LSYSTPRKARAGQGPDPFARLDEGKLWPVYVFLSEDPGLADEFIARLRAALIDPGLASFDLEMLAADELDIEDARQKLCQLPVGAHRLVVIRDLTRPGADGPVYSELKKNGTVELCKALGALAAGSSKKGKSDDEKSVHAVVTALPKKELAPIFKETGLTKYVVELAPPEADELTGMVKRWAAERKLTLDADAARLLIDIAGESTGTLRSEIEKFATVSPDGRVTAALVRELAGCSREFQLKEYVDRVLERDPARAIPILRGLEEWGEDTPKIIGWLVNGFLGLVAAKSRGWRASAAGRWASIEEINRCLQQLYKVNRAKMTGKGEEFARLELFTLCVACRAERPACGLPRDNEEHELCMLSRRRRRRVAVS